MHTHTTAHKGFGHFVEAGLAPLAPALWQNWLLGPSLRIVWASSVLWGVSLCVLEPLSTMSPDIAPMSRTASGPEEPYPGPRPPVELTQIFYIVC